MTRSKTDRASAVSYLDEYLATNPDTVFPALLTAWMPVEPDAAGARLLEYLNRPHSGESTAQAAEWTTNILRPWIERDAPTAARFVPKLPAEVQQSVMEAVAAQWCQKDGAAAAQWASALPAGSTRDTALTEFTYAWAQHDTTQATAWLDRLPQDSGLSALNVVL